MKTILTNALLLAAIAAGAQDQAESTVHIRKVEKVNGVEKVWDTTYSAVPGENMEILDRAGVTGCDGKRLSSFVTVIDDGKGGDGEYTFTFRDSLAGEHSYRVVTTGGELTPEQKQRFEMHRKGAHRKTDEGTAATVHENVIVMEKPSDGQSSVRRVLIVRAIRISDASPGETAALAPVDNNLKVEQLVCYPNPASDRVKLSFNLPQPGEAEVAIYSPGGQQVHKEKLSGAEGRFGREIDLSGLSKGIYFLRIIQGNKAHTKKLVIE